VASTERVVEWWSSAELKKYGDVRPDLRVKVPKWRMRVLRMEVRKAAFQGGRAGEVVGVGVMVMVRMAGG
jgi:hypothetical protein